MISQGGYIQFYKELGMMWSVFWDFLNYDLVLFGDFHFTLWDIFLMCFLIGTFRFILRTFLDIDFSEDFNFWDE